jgi:hypothetical protein
MKTKTAYNHYKRLKVLHQLQQTQLQLVLVTDQVKLEQH